MNDERVAVIIPAYNEEATVGEVVDVAKSASRVDEVIVVDNGSSDGTSEAAKERGARLVSHPEGGKGQAMAAGVAATDAEVLVFLDADLTGLQPDHVDRLVRPVLEGEAGMSCGLFDRGSLLNPIFLHLLPQLTGERAVRRELFESLEPEARSGYQVEAALNSAVSELGMEVDAFICEGMSHRTKSEKSESRISGWLKTLAMLLTAGGASIAFWVVRRRRG
jgi:glycosyltransferase involved in cell wall biosynthesis